MRKDLSKSTDIPRATHKGTLYVTDDIAIPCYVLTDGRRVLYHRGTVTALGMSRGGSSKGGGDRIAHFVNGERLSAFLDKQLIEVTTNPFLFRTDRGVIAYGYEATVLVDLCDAVIEARNAGVLQKQQMHIAQRCEMLIRAFAKVGIIALVDEATGYQADRDRDELQRILAGYIAPELMPWTKRFPNEFYQELFRLRSWQYRPITVKRPKFVGKLTNQLIYEKLPPGILDELRRREPVTEKGYRKHKFHQHLTPDIGEKHLERQIAVVLTLMRISPNWTTFQRHFNRAFPEPGHQFDLALNDEDDE